MRKGGWEVSCSECSRDPAAEMSSQEPAAEGDKTSRISSHKRNAGMPSIRAAASRAMASASDGDCETALSFSHIQPKETIVCS